MATIIKPPEKIVITDGIPSIFLAGSIEMGQIEDWQSLFERELEGSRVTVLNPRREEWDASWKQSIDNTQFREQVEWELEGQERADIIAMYFVPGTKSPITLLELGLFAGSKKLIVCCPDGYWRKGNVDIVCRRYSIATADSLKSLVDAVLNKVLI
jgi:hypothetical protein